MIFTFNKESGKPRLTRVILYENITTFYRVTMNDYIKNLKYDIPAAIIVFLVAVPLCLGIALASFPEGEAILFSGIIAGIVGGIIVGFLSGSQLGVSGPAAGLAVIVLNAINDLGAFETFLLAVVIGGAIQLIFLLDILLQAN